MKNIKNECPEDFDTSDAPMEPAQASARRPPPVPVRVQKIGGPPKFLPGATSAPYTRGPKREATPFASQSRRARSDTQPIPVSQEQMFDVAVPGIATYRVPASDPNQAALRIDAHLRSGADPDVKGRNFDYRQFKVTPAPAAEASGAAGIVGHQDPRAAYEARLREAVRRMVVREIVRKVEGGFGVYKKNPGKKKPPKLISKHPTRLAAKRAELAVDPPRDPEQLKKARKRLDKLKDPKKRAEAERRDIVKKPSKKGKPSGARKKAVRESFISGVVGELMERLFHEDEIPGSPWDERIASINPDAISSDKRFSSLNKGLEKASYLSLGDAGKILGKVLKGMAKVSPGDITHDPDRRKTFMPVMLDCDGYEVGPVHLYVDGGHVKIEISPEARQAIMELDPDYARDLRGGLMSFQEDHLPKISYARDAWTDRDSYLDKLHSKLEKHVSGLTGIEAHLMKQLLGKGGKRK